jgi:hypothetical protein
MRLLAERAIRDFRADARQGLSRIRDRLSIPARGVRTPPPYAQPAARPDGWTTNRPKVGHRDKERTCNEQPDD